ncbi:MAG TPA: hypothetical protein VKS44_03380 [Candidatus Acidoferrales bacterium]|nr:hypothetical protein [Candidatus Acidoferrales bacterium]
MKLKLKLVLLTIALLLFAGGSARTAYAAPQGPGCSMLTPAQIQKVLGQPFGAPTVGAWPPAYGQQPWGSQCRYSSQKGPHVAVNFIVYLDASPAEAKQTFEKLAMWFAPKSKPAIGDSAYIDKDGAIHVLKGKVRYYISLDPQNEKQMKDLAASIAGRI